VTGVNLKRRTNATWGLSGLQHGPGWGM